MAFGSNKNNDLHAQATGLSSLAQMGTGPIAAARNHADLAPEPEIKRLVNGLFERTEMLSMRLAELEKALSPILRPQNTEEGPTSGPPCETDLGASLSTIAARISAMHCDVTVMINALAL